MANSPFSAPDLLFDLRINIEKIKQKDDTSPTDVRAFLSGVLDGLSLENSAFLKNVFTNYGDEIVTQLATLQSEASVSLHVLVKSINQRTFFDEVVKIEDFSKATEFGATKSAKYYCQGVAMAISWASNLYYSAKSHEMEKEAAKRSSLLHIEFVRKIVAVGL